MYRRQFLASAAVFTACPRRRNVLLLIGECPSSLEGGVRFPNAFCTTPSHGASLSVIHSGLHNHTNGCYGTAGEFHHFAYVPSVRPLSSLLKDAGYCTGVIGAMPVHPAARFRWDLESAEGDEAAAFMSHADRPWFLQAGRNAAGVFAMLRRCRQIDSTLVIWTDSGGLRSQHATMSDPRIRVPLVMRCPLQAGRERVNPQLVSLADIAPTVLEWTRVTGPDYSLHGRSLFHRGSDDRVFLSHTFDGISAYHPVRGVRTGSFKYLVEVAPMGCEALYDLRNDPLETSNAARLPAYRRTLQELRSQVRAFRLQTQDPWFITNENHRS